MEVHEVRRAIRSAINRLSAANVAADAAPVHAAVQLDEAAKEIAAAAEGVRQRIAEADEASS